MSWLALALLGGVVGLDATAFPQVMISRPLVAGTLTGALFGRPLAGLAVGFLMEVFALIVLPFGATRSPEYGTAAVAATGAYLAATPADVEPGTLLLALTFGLVWERLAGETVVLQRRSNGRILIARAPLGPGQLERRHLAAMTLDFTRGAVVAASGGLLGYGLLRLLAPFWGLPPQATLAVLGIVSAGLLGTAIRLFGGGSQRRVALAAGAAVGLVLALGAA